jgi:hypothetical protein
MISKNIFTFHDHYNIDGRHAVLSPSKYHWIRYDDEKIARSYFNYLAAERGTRLHAFACESILLGIKLPRSKKTLNMYVNDAIGYKMTPEQPLYFSENCFGTADAISFKRNILRIHDLKTGIAKGSLEQLQVYAAIFCLEYNIDPNRIDIELRIYQADEINALVPEGDTIKIIMNKILHADKYIDKIKMGE